MFVQWKPLNAIILVQNQLDNINWMIKITGGFYSLSYSKWNVWNVITLSRLKH